MKKRPAAALKRPAAYAAKRPAVTVAPDSTQPEAGVPPARRTARQLCTLSPLFAELSFYLKLRIFSFAQRSAVVDVSVNDYDDGELIDYKWILKPSKIPKVLRGVLSGSRFYCVSELPLYRSNMQLLEHIGLSERQADRMNGCGYVIVFREIGGHVQMTLGNVKGYGDNAHLIAPEKSRTWFHAGDVCDEVVFCDALMCLSRSFVRQLRQRVPCKYAFKLQVNYSLVPIVRMGDGPDFTLTFTPRGKAPRSLHWNTDDD